MDASASTRRYGFVSPSTAPGVLKAYYEGDVLILDASDAREDAGALEEAREMELFRAPAGNIDKLTVSFAKPRDYARIAAAASEVFERVMNGVTHGFIDMAGVPAGEIRFEEIKIPDKK